MTKSPNRQATSLRPLTLDEIASVSGGDKVDFHPKVCTKDKPENSAFGGAMVALAILLLL